MTKYCYIHESKEAFRECENCGRYICHDCTEKYWQTNAIYSMFLPQRKEVQEMNYCPKCLKRAKIKNAFISGSLLILVIGTIAATIIVAVLQ